MPATDLAHCTATLIFKHC